MKKLNFLYLFIALALSFTSCVDKDYDDIVTANVDPNITPTHTIAQLQAMATGSVGKLIDTDVIVAGIVAGDDATGNIYKQIILQQDSSGIAIQVDISNYYTEYPEGRRIFVNCKGLYIANNSGNYELGATPANPVGRIPANLVSRYLTKGKWGQHLTPKVYQLNSTIPTNTLVRFNNVEFEDGNNGVAYAASSPGILVLKDCISNEELDVYTSTFATFALEKSPVGNGSITGVYIQYNGAGELLLRNTGDVDMNGIRCDGSNGQTTIMPIDSVRMLYSGTNTNAPTGRKIKATVISNYTTVMINNQNIYVQDGTAGIQVRFSAAHSFAVGTELEIIISGREISEFNGVLQINGVPLGNASAVGSGSVTPLNTTIDQLIANYDQWESRLVKIDNVTISGSPGTYSGSKTISDGVNTIVLFTSSLATFANDTFPTGPVSVTGILIEYQGTKEIIIRSPADVQ